MMRNTDINIRFRFFLLLQLISDLELQITDLEEQLHQSNQLRKQQLVELGLLREEERLKMQAEYEAQVWGRK